MARKSQTKTGEALWAFWKPKGIVSPKNARAFQAWLKKHAGGIDIATFIHDSTHDKKHARAVTELIK